MRCLQSYRLPVSIAIVLLCTGLSTTASAAARALATDDYWLHRITCDYPFRLTRDCSIWHGATREIAFGDYRLNLAAAEDGRTLLVAGIRFAPDHNGTAFRDQRQDRGERALALIDQLDATLSQHGVRLERLLPVRRGRRIAGYFLAFSDDAYAILKDFTVLESHHWLPQQASRD